MNTQSHLAPTDEAILEQFMRDTEPMLFTASDQNASLAELLALLNEARSVLNGLDN